MVDHSIAPVKNGGAPSGGRRTTSTSDPAGVDGCRIVDLPKITDPRGNITFIEGTKHIPFVIKRAFYLYDVPGGESRGGHAHRDLEQFMIAASGSFDVVVKDGRDTRRFFLNRSYYGLYIPPMVWREMENFSSGSVCLVLASEFFDESDYFREYHEFLAATPRRP